MSNIVEIVERLTENIVARDLRQEGAALVSKWEKTGLLEGLGDDRVKDNMSRLLENQAKELLREASSMAVGDVEGFAAVAFPIVRRVFGGLLANDLVSVQPMSLPSGLIFFLDFTKGNGRLGDASGDSVYGGGRVASQITGGVDLTGVNNEKSFYSLNNGYSSPVSGGAWDADVQSNVVASGAFDANGEFNLFSSDGAVDEITVAQAREILKYDPDIASGALVLIHSASISDDLAQLNRDNLISVSLQTQEGFPLTASNANGGAIQARRLTSYLSSDVARDTLYMVTVHTASVNTDDNNADVIVARARLAAAADGGFRYLQYATADNFTGADAVGGVKGAAEWLLESDVSTVSGNFDDDLGAIPEIDKS
jgi:hypothetical protein